MLLYQPEATLQGARRFHTRRTAPTQLTADYIPSSWTALHSLRELDLRNNPLGPSFMQSLSNLLQSRSSLDSLYLDGIPNLGQNGVLPQSWSKFVQLKGLSMNDIPSLTGPLPAAWSALSNLEILELSDTGVVGQLPAGWSTMTDMRVLSLARCGKLAGSLPRSWSNLASLQLLDLSETGIAGTLPDSWSVFSSRGVWLSLPPTVTACQEWAQPWGRCRPPPPPPRRCVACLGGSACRRADTGTGARSNRINNLL